MTLEKLTTISIMLVITGLTSRETVNEGKFLKIIAKAVRREKDFSDRGIETKIRVWLVNYNNSPLSECTFGYYKRTLFTLYFILEIMTWWFPVPEKNNQKHHPTNKPISGIIQCLPSKFMFIFCEYHHKSQLIGVCLAGFRYFWLAGEWLGVLGRLAMRFWK